MNSSMQSRLLQATVNADILRFGTFTLKSGRISPYFFNAGLFNTGALLSLLCSAYVELIMASKLEFDVLYGPAYKGIPLAAVTASKLASQEQHVGYAYNRKEESLHGDEERLVGASLRNKRVLIIDDAMTAGTAIREAIKIIKEAGGELVGIVVAFDRQERAPTSSLSTAMAVEQESSIKEHTILGFGDVIDFSRATLSHEKTQVMEAYMKQYGI